MPIERADIPGDESSGAPPPPGDSSGPAGDAGERLGGFTSRDAKGRVFVATSQADADAVRDEWTRTELRKAGGLAWWWYRVRRWAGGGGWVS